MDILTIIQSVNWTKVSPILISLLALLVSAIALWKTTFSKFNSIFSVGDLRLHIYPIRNGKEKWFIASVDLPLSVANDGAKPGRISDMHIHVYYPKLPIPNHWEIFSPKWDIDTTKFRKSEDRFRWIDNAVLSDWMPFIVLSKQTISKHLIFETRWDKPVIQEKVTFTLEVKTDVDKEWKKIDSWNLSLTKEIWSELTEIGTSIGTASNKNLVVTENLLSPKDLHKYTGTDESIPHGGFKAKPSYMNYPKTRVS